jgi:hypothetical protein
MSAMAFSDIRPTVVMADSSPLIHLAAVGHLDLLRAFGPVVIADVVHLETCLDLAKPFAAEIAAWIDSNADVRVEDTDLGPIYRLAIEQNKPRPRNSGERAIVDWLAEHIVHEGGPALVVYKNGKIPNMLRREGLPEDVVVTTSRYFLKLAQERGLIADAEAVWARVAQIDTHSNPVAEATIIERSM